MPCRPLWRCPKCRRRFANRNQSHACGRYDLEHHFSHKSPQIRALFDDVVAAIRSIGPVRILPEKTRIAFQMRMSFAQIRPKAKWLDGHVVLARRFEHPRFRQIQTISPRNHVHSFRITSPGDIDEDFKSGSPRHTKLASNAISKERSNQSMQPTQHFVESFGLMRTPIFKVLGGLSTSR